MSKKLTTSSWEPYKILIVGDSGAGKTTLASTAPGSQYWFCFENGLISVAGSQAVRDKLEFDEFLPQPHDPKLAGTAWAEATKQLEFLSQNPNKYDVVVVDSLSSLSELAFEHAMARSGSAGQILSPGQPGVNGMAVYGMAGNLAWQFIKGLLSLPCNKIFIGHEAYDKDEVTQRVMFTLSMIGRMVPSRIPKEFDEIWRCETQVTKNVLEYKVRTKNSLKFKAKSRWSGCAQLDELEEANIENILSKVAKAFV